MKVNNILRTHLGQRAADEKRVIKSSWLPSERPGFDPSSLEIVLISPWMYELGIYSTLKMVLKRIQSRMKNKSKQRLT